MKNILGLFIGLLLFSCGGKENKNIQNENTTPIIADNGSKITFPTNEGVNFFETETISSSTLNAEFTAPAKVAAMVVASHEGASENLILFEDPELASNYTLLIQHLITINQIKDINIKQKKIELDRIKDLQAHGSATGRELLEAQTVLAMEETNLHNERTAIIEHEAKLKSNGFDPERLRRATLGTSYIICDIPENQISKIKVGSSCVLEFVSFPNEKFIGKIDDVADMIDNATRMIKLRITLDNKNNKLKTGMFATASFGISESNVISIQKNSLITVKGKNYVFVKTSDRVFERREVSIGIQINDRIVIYSGVNAGDKVAIKGVMQLKGLSFGY